MQAAFDKIIAGLLPEGEAVLIALSGGRDSIALADLFLNSRRSYKLLAAHCNFHLRGAESDEDEAFVRSWCNERGLELVVKGFDTHSYFSIEGVSVEMAARDLRYRWFESLCVERGIGATAVAHHADDNAETLILNLLRGTGIKGLCGMRPSSMIPLKGSTVRLIRPLLGFSREQIDSYILLRGLSYREDRTNAESEVTRNKIRNQVFPVFKQINPSFVRTFAEDMKHFAAVYDANSPLSEDDAGQKELIISLKDLPIGPQRGVMLFDLMRPYGFAPRTIEALDRVLAEGETLAGKMFISPKAVAYLTSSSIQIVPNGQQNNSAKAPDTMVVRAEGQYSVGEHLIEVSFCEDPSSVQLPPPVGVTVADADAVGLPFVIGPWTKGDWFRPYGMTGRKLLSDLFVDLKWSQMQKRNALILRSSHFADHLPDGHVAALIGVRIDDAVKVVPDTKKILIVKILR